jgi:predicted DNA-binding transcriptional regulator YafY
MVVSQWRMSRASIAQKAERLNLAWALLRQRNRPSVVIQQLVQDCSISPRQAQRYLQRARNLRGPLAVPASDAKVAFTVKLSRPLVTALRNYAAESHQALGECVTQALLAMLSRGRRRG